MSTSVIQLKCNHKGGFPAWANDSFSVFQNVWGEQWIAAWRGKDIVISGGDIDWSEIVVSIVDLLAWHTEKKDKLLPPPLMHTTFNDEELHWILAVLHMAGRVLEMKQ